MNFTSIFPVEYKGKQYLNIKADTQEVFNLSVSDASGKLDTEAAMAALKEAGKTTSFAKATLVHYQDRTFVSIDLSAGDDIF